MYFLAAKHRLLTMSELVGKGKQWLVSDPKKVEIRVCLDWVLCHVPDFSVHEAFGNHAKFEEVAREAWRVSGFQVIQSTTRNVRIVFDDGVTLDQLSHQLELQGTTTLVLLPGSPPVYLRCRHRPHAERSPCASLQRLPLFWKCG